MIERHRRTESLRITRALLCLLLSPWLDAATATQVSIEWQVPRDFAKVTAADQKAILELARTFGINQMDRLIIESVEVPGICVAVTVRSAAFVEGNRRRYDTLFVRGKGWPRCAATGSGPELQVKDWRAGESALRLVEEWRVSDGDWYVDATLGEPVAYDVAERIVRALHRKELVLGSGLRGSAKDLPDIGSSDLRVTRREMAEYMVKTGRYGGHLFHVRLSENGSIELAMFTTWIS